MKAMARERDARYPSIDALIAALRDAEETFGHTPPSVYAAVLTPKPPAMTPEQQRRKLNLEVARIKQESSEDANFHQLYVALEDLALRQVEAENQMPLLRNIVLEGVPFDGVTVKDGRVFCVEVTFVVVPDLPQERVDALLDKVEYAARRIRQKVPAMRVRLLLALVTKLNQQAENRLRSSLADKFSLTPVDVDVRFLRHDLLQKTFIAE